MTEQSNDQNTQSTDDVAVDASQSPEPTPNTAPLQGSESYDDEDVPAALARETQDGSGFKDEHELPAEDFAGYASDDVEESE